MTTRTITIADNQWVTVSVAAQDDQGAPRPIHGTVTVSDYNQAYPHGGATAFGLVPKVAAPQGGSLTLSATFQAFSADGTALDPVQLDVTIQGAPNPPQASVLVMGEPAIPATSAGDTLHGTPADPGSAQITF